MSDAKPEISPTERLLNAQIKLYYDVHKPEGFPAPLLVALHGYGANKRQMMRAAKEMVPANFAIASLQGFHQHMKEPKEPGGPLRFGFGWVTNFHPEESVALHHQALLDLVRTLITDGIADPEHVFLLGFSQSCALNYRFAFAHPDFLRGVVGICGGIPGDWDTSDRYKPTKARILHLAGANDDFYTPSRISDYERQLRMRADDVELRSYDAAHEIVPAMRDDVRAWLSNTQ